jgi:drug/metabolite transporter (DMT)-like permease
MCKWLLAADLAPFTLAGLLYLGAALGVAPAAIRSAPLAALRGAEGRRNRMRIAGAIALGGVAGPVLLLSGLEHAGAASVSLWLNLELFATAVLGVWLFHDQLSGRAWAGVLCALLAAGLLSYASGAAGVVAGGLVLLACVAWGIDNHLTALIDGLTPSQSTLVKGVVAGTVNLAIGSAAAPLPESGLVIAGALLVGTLSYGVSIALYIQSAQLLGATRAQVAFATSPLFGVAIAVVGLGEPMTVALVVAAGLFAVAVALVMLDAHDHEHAHRPIVHSHSHRHDDGHHDHEHEGLSPATRHAHVHEHAAIVHRHPHVPDLHHRHGH